MLKRRVTEKNEIELLLEAFLESGIDCSLRNPGKSFPEKILGEYQGSFFEITPDFNIFDENYLKRQHEENYATLTCDFSLKQGEASFHLPSLENLYLSEYTLSDIEISSTSQCKCSEKTLLAA